MHQAHSHPAALDRTELLEACDVRQLRRSGPGGQRRNKVETAVNLRHRPTGVEAEANERRSQAENQAVALFRLRVNLALEVRTAGDAEFDPQPAVAIALQGGRIGVSHSHDDFPAILAEALDAIDHADADVKEAAAKLRCTASQLVKLLKKEPRAMALVNLWRRERGLHALQ